MSIVFFYIQKIFKLIVDMIRQTKPHHKINKLSLVNSIHPNSRLTLLTLLNDCFFRSHIYNVYETQPNIFNVFCIQINSNLENSNISLSKVEPVEISQNHC